MTIVRLGRTGLNVSEICLGTMTFGLQTERAESAAITDAAELGIDFFDVADVYPLCGSLETVGRIEEIVGDWLVGKRENFVLATKTFNPMGPRPNDTGNSRKHVIAASEASLRRLKTDYIDLYYIHRWDDETPIDETLEAFDDLRAAGTIRYAGCPLLASAPRRSASDRFAEVRSAPLRLAELRSAPRRSALYRSAPRRYAPDRFALDRFAPVRFAAPYGSAPVRFEFVRFAPIRFASCSCASGQVRAV
jgi:aryl-alcohol dehydrogenase-like predicted oxidoreductase